MGAWFGEKAAAKPGFGILGESEQVIDGHHLAIRSTLWGEIIEIKHTAKYAAEAKEHEEYFEKLEKGRI